MVNRLIHTGKLFAALLGLIFVATGCGDTAGLSIKASYGEEVPQSTRERARRVEVYLVESCESVAAPERPSDPLGSTFSLRDSAAGSEPAPIEVPPPGDYGLYALAFDEDCAVVASGCASVTIDAEPLDTLSVSMQELSGFGCPDEKRCVIETGACVDSGGTGGSSGAGGAGGAGTGCVDLDGDGLGNGSGNNAGCLDPTTDSDDTNERVCADTDADGCDDCESTRFDPSDDGEDLDRDGTCAQRDCDDAVGSCASDCTTNSDNDAHVDCFEEFCGTNPYDSASVCRVASTEAELKNAIDAANARIGHDYVVLESFTLNSDPPALEDPSGLTIRQVAGAALTVDSGSSVFELKSNNNLIDGVRVFAASSIDTIVSVKGDDNVVRNSEIRGFDRRGIYVDGGDRAQILHNTISGGSSSPGNETGAIILKDTTGSVVAGNTIALNAMDGVQVRKSVGPVIDHNTLADNGGSGLSFYGDPSSGVCVRNNNVTGNAEFGLEASETISFDIVDCIEPLSTGPKYGNNGFDNDARCGGNECIACVCLPAGPFWGYSVGPAYRAVVPGAPHFYCLGEDSTLIDEGDDLLSYDLNGAARGRFNSASPDIGSREDGAGDCN